MFRTYLVQLLFFKDVGILEEKKNRQLLSHKENGKKLRYVIILEKYSFGKMSKISKLNYKQTLMPI